MSLTAQNQKRAATKTPDRWVEATAALGPWMHRMTKRTDLAFGVLAEMPAPAWYDDATNEVDLNAQYLVGIDPYTVSRPDFIRLHAALAGAVIHEGAHAHFSRMNMRALYEQHGLRWLNVLHLLEEGRAERQQLPFLRPIDKAALRACILEIVLRDVPEDVTEALGDHRAALRLLGLMASRIKTKVIVLKDAPNVAKMWAAVPEVLGQDVFEVFHSLALRFAAIDWEVHDYYGSRENTEPLRKMDLIIQQWMEAEDTLLPPPPEPPPGEGKGEPGEGEGEGDPTEGQGAGEGEGKPEDGEDEAEGKGAGEGEGEKTDGEGTKPRPPRKKPRWGREEQEHSGDGDASQSDYADGVADSNESNVITKMLDQIREDVGAVKERIITTEIELGERELVKADATAHATRRANNALYGTRWK